MVQIDYVSSFLLHDIHHLSLELRTAVPKIS